MKPLLALLVAAIIGAADAPQPTEGMQLAQQGKFDEALPKLQDELTSTESCAVAATLVNVFPRTKGAAASQAVRMIRAWNTAVKADPAHCAAMLDYFDQESLVTVANQVKDVERQLAAAKAQLDSKETIIKTHVEMNDRLQHQLDQANLRIDGLIKQHDARDDVMIKLLDKKNDGTPR